MQEYFIMFAKVFGLLIVLFIGVIALFVYPTNLLYKNEKFESKWDTDRLLTGAIIFLIIISALLYYYYHVGNNYMCNISSYFDCTSGKHGFGVYILLLIHLCLFIAFTAVFINKLKEIIKSKKLDIYLFLFASFNILLVLFNYKIYENLFSNIELVYFPVKILIYLVVYSPLYLFLVINYLINPKEKKKKKKKAIKKK